MSLKLSIITVTLNNLKGLRKTYDSIKKQTYEDILWIIIDGGSNDGTIEFVSSIPHHLFICEPDQGIYDAMNKGIGHTNGHYTLFLNAGDMLANQTVIEQIFKSIGSHKDFIYCDSIEDNNYKAARSHLKKKYGMFTHHQSMIYRSKLLKQMRYDEDYKIAADYDLTLRFLRDAQEIIHISKPLCIYESGGISQQYASLGRKEQYLIREKLHICGKIENWLIYNLQKFNLLLRQYTPIIYWRFKSRRASLTNL